MYMYIIYTHIYNPLYIVGELRYIYIYISRSRLVISHDINIYRSIYFIDLYIPSIIYDVVDTMS